MRRDDTSKGRCGRTWPFAGRRFVHMNVAQAMGHLLDQKPFRKSICRPLGMRNVGTPSHSSDTSRYPCLHHCPAETVPPAECKQGAKGCHIFHTPKQIAFASSVGSRQYIWENGSRKSTWFPHMHSGSATGTAIPSACKTSGRLTGR